MPSLLPIDNGPLGRKRAAHLLRRTTFGPSGKDIDRYAQLNIQQALDQLFTPTARPLPPLDIATGAAWVNPNTAGANSPEWQLIEYTLSWWTDRFMRGEDRIHARLIWYLHTHYPIIKERIPRSTALYHHMMLLWHYALGNYKELAVKMCYDNAMLWHLDGHLNEKDRPNENFAREFFELFTVGKGMQTGPDNYTTFDENDVREAARVLTGFGIDQSFSNVEPETGIAMGILKGDGQMAQRHDAGIKNFSAAFGNVAIAPPQGGVINGVATKEATMQELHDFADMVFAQPATAAFLARKLYRFFVYYEISDTVERDIITPLAEQLINSDYQIIPILRRLLSSRHFFDDDNATEEDDVTGAIIKSPVELMASAIHFFDAEFPDSDGDLTRFYQAHAFLRGQMQLQGLDLFEPFDVNGYDAYHQMPAFNRNWITANTLAHRYKFGLDIVNGIKPMNDNDLIKIDVVRFVNQNISQPEEAIILAREIIDHLLPNEITEERFMYFYREILLDTLSEINWRFEWRAYKQSQDDTAVRIQLEKFISALLQSPEFQLC
ncbi:MAG: DUF1800 family protein [Cyclobacteriaceae bacterium]|nr:DUF1800 family protein [Cyclobacteriaceae bacterium]